MNNHIPRIFICSSSEGIEVARAVETNLNQLIEGEIELWNHGQFAPSVMTLDALYDVAQKFSFAIIVLTPDDKSEIRRETKLTPRDNVIFELGFFIAHFGRSRTFVIRNTKCEILTDLSGMTVAQYKDREDKNFVAAVSPACSAISNALKHRQVETNQIVQIEVRGDSEVHSGDQVTCPEKTDPH